MLKKKEQRKNIIRQAPIVEPPKKVLAPGLTVERTRGIYYNTDILKDYFGGNINEICSQKFGDKEPSRKVYIVEHEGKQAILKIISSPDNLIEEIKQAEKEYDIAFKYSKENIHFASPLGKERFEDKQSKTIHIETLYEYGGEDLYSQIGTLKGKDLMMVIKKSLSPLAFLEINHVFHGDIKPQNIVIKDGLLKVIDFGISTDFQSKTMKMRKTGTVSDRLLGLTEVYSPPEIICKRAQGTEFYLHKIDVYCWGMTIYHLISCEKELDLLAEVANFKKGDKALYEGFLNKVMALEFPGDIDKQFTRLFIPILRNSLLFEPAERPSFTALNFLLGEEIDNPRPMPNLEVQQEDNKNVQSELEKLKKECEALKAKNKELTDLKMQLEDEKSEIGLQQKNCISDLEKSVEEIGNNYSIIDTMKENFKNLTQKIETITILYKKFKEKTEIERMFSGK